VHLGDAAVVAAAARNREHNEDERGAIENQFTQSQNQSAYRRLLNQKDRDAPRYLGAYAFETSAYSKLSEWPGGGIIGLHGTSMPWLLGKPVSHGCVRMSNLAALRLKRLTRAGTPLRITA
jgi:lipoprotein-anchoring transpeptidase ErfK/SrfK